MSSSRPTCREMFLLPAGRWPAAERRRLEDAFFRRLRLPGGVTKRTRRGRLADLDHLLAQHLPAGQPLELMDVAVSSGVTTLDWVRSLEASHTDFHLLAGDLALDATLLSWHFLGWPWLETLVNTQGEPLQFDLFGRAIPSSAPGPFALLPFLLRTLTAGGRAQAGAGRAEKRSPVDVSIAGANRPPAPGGWPTPPTSHNPRFGISSHPVSLLLPDLAQHPRVEIVSDDLRQPSPAAWENRFDALRAANILNRDYFSPQDLATMTAHLARRLKPGGLLAVCRNDAAEVPHATLFRRAGHHLEAIAHLGRGSDVDDLVLTAP